MKFRAALLYSVVFIRAALSRESAFRLYIEKQSNVRHAVFERKGIDFVDEILSQTSRVALIGNRGIYIPVANDDFSLFYRRNYQLFYELGARRGVKQSLGFVRFFGVVSVEDYFADFFRYRSAARLSREYAIVTVTLKILC